MAKRNRMRRMREIAARLYGNPEAEVTDKFAPGTVADTEGYDVEVSDEIDAIREVKEKEGDTEQKA